MLTFVNKYSKTHSTIANKRCLLYFRIVNEKLIDYDEILSSCGFGTEPANVVINKISNLEEFYSSDELIKIYNYILENVDDIEILLNVVKLADQYRNNATLNILLNILRSNDPQNINSDDYTNLRVMCAKAIANYKDNSTVTLILSCLNDKNVNYKIRLACADALGRIGDRYAVRPLLEVVEDEEEKSVYLKESATFALGLLGDTSAIDPLISILESKQGLWDKFSFLKEKIVETLGKLNLHSNQKILKALKNSLMDSSPMVRINAIEAIMNSNDDTAENLIMPCLNDDDDEVKRNALIALYNLRGRDILDEVLDLPIYSDFLKNEAQSLIDEYEDDDRE